MPQEFEYFLKFNEQLVKKARTMEWLETTFDKIITDGRLCRTALVVAIQGKCTIGDVANVLSLEKSTVSQYLKELAKKKS
jgi:predicted transcriptional regulator